MFEDLIRTYSSEEKRSRVTSNRYHHELDEQSDSHPAHYPSRALKDMGVRDFVVNGKLSLLQIHHPHVTTVVAETTAQGTRIPAKKIRAVPKAEEEDDFDLDAWMIEESAPAVQTKATATPAIHGKATAAPAASAAPSANAEDGLFGNLFDTEDNGNMLLYKDLYSICTKKSKLIIH